MEAGGLSCELVAEGEPVQLTPGTDLVGYRVMEAALGLLCTQDARQAVATIRYGASWLELEVLGPTAVPGAEGRLEAITERVSLYDGTLDLVPDGGRFCLRARLPLGARVAA
jgi:hypothetical protein